MSFHFVNAVEQILSGHQSCLYVASLDEVTEKEQLTFRELMRTAFADQGIEIEFSGKGINERGVIIDMDEEKLSSAGIAADLLRFGQTVVRVKQ